VWHDVARFTETIAGAIMVIAIALTLYSLYLYLRDYGYLLRARPVAETTGSRRL